MIKLSMRIRKTVYVATNAELMNAHYYRRLWIAVRNITIPRRDWLDELADTFRDADVELLYKSGEPYDLPDIDDLFDGSDMRWMSRFLKAAPSNKHPKSKARSIERLRVMDLYFRVKHPCIAKHFGK